ncbi:hypothetical protein J6590_089427 [Homalodisca vitripennis]|nr:hypothetical protein J6590_089427 [Homalodisca vitripennis]
MRLASAAIAVISIQLIHLLCFYTLTDAKNVERKIKIRLYNQTSDKYYEAPIKKGRSLFKPAFGYNQTLPLVLIVHGMAMGADSYFVNGVINALVGRQLDKEYNIFAVDMPELFQNNLFNNFYFGVLSNVQPAGKRIGEFLNEVIKLNMTTPASVSLIGYSIGAQIAGYTARLVKEVSGQINYIAGLDPAGPGFHNLFGRVSGLTHVSQADAGTAHFFHTNSVSCGTRDRVGTADFVFNSGGLQPGCLVESSLNCSHVRIPNLYIEAITNPGNLVARRCPSWAQFKQCQCDQHDSVLLTFPPDQRLYNMGGRGPDEEDRFKSSKRCVVPFITNNDEVLASLDIRAFHPTPHGSRQEAASIPNLTRPIRKQRKYPFRL